MSTEPEVTVEVDENVAQTAEQRVATITRIPCEITGDLQLDTDSVRAAVAHGNALPAAFVTAGEMTRLGRNDEGHPVIKLHTSASFSYWVAQHSAWTKTTRRGVSRVNPPIVAVNAVMNLADALDEAPRLERVVQVPFFNRKRHLVTDEGYNRSSRTWYQPSQRFTVPRVNEDPSPSQVEAARSLILDDLLVDFPFASAGDRAGAVAMLLETFVKDVITGNTPLHLVEASTPGTGKSKLVENCLAVGLGCQPRDVPGKPLAHDEAEIRKGITTSLMSGTPAVFFDNVSHAIKSAALAQALTGGTWTDRRLGASEDVEFKIRCSWVMTSNNASYDADTARRISLIRLDLSKLDGVDAAVKENPSIREGFKHTNLEGWVTDHQDRLVWACLTLVQHWLAEGGKPWTGRPLGSFESWSQVMGGILEAVGIDGFLTNRDQIEPSTGGNREDVIVFLEAWRGQHGDVDVLPADLVRANESQENPLGLKADKSGNFSVPMGYWLRKNKDRVVGGYQICQSTINKRKWQLHQV